MENPEEKLVALRTRIDEIDVKLADLFNTRIGIIREVAALKAEHWPKSCHIRPGREGKMHQALASRFSAAPFPPLAALAIWRQLIGASTHVESPLNVVSLNAHPDHAWLAREYFGVQVGISRVPSLVDAFAQFRAGTSNILLLPTPTLSDWWRAAESMRAAGLFIFASLPVVGANLPEGTMPAVALAAVAPEDSGDDVSYHVQSGELITRAGFHPNEDGIFLGAHPRAIQLGA